ncbi:hypothetical protein [Kiloniella majae]|uniref:hypothetical protein n=1 Tax=Kiloniella majae TaxID=1938558 RepID=UPI000A2792A5|nr:hypothetical protein [Kiloniella majae]
MGGKSSSKSSSSTSSNVTDNRFGVESEGIGVSASGNSTVNVTDFDPEVVEQFRGIASDVADTLGKGYDSVSDITSAVTGLAGETIKDSLQIVAEASEDNAKEIAESTIKYLVLGVAATIVAVAYFWKK